ncbi:hypothetical protein [Teredinibacter waterburyi]|uniref:LpxL/LpxP family acyltransferase n=1 Tax=Teredinibacter waterburyi TaxID=1500538 RepID=UPI00165F7764
MKRSLFTSNLLHPRCWLTWLGFGLWWLVVQILPYRVQMALGAGLGILAALALAPFVVATTSRFTLRSRLAERTPKPMHY